MTSPLTSLGWSDHFAHQTELDETMAPTRITAVHRSRLDGFQEGGTVSLSPTVEAGRYAVGDWVIATGAAASEPLERTLSLIHI